MFSGFIMVLALILASALCTTNAAQLCLDEHNTERQKVGKPNLTWDTKLELAAVAHNMKMGISCFDHQCPNEDPLTVRITNAGFDYSNVTENIAADKQNCGEVVNSWMNSALAKNNILGNFANIGCAKKPCKGCTYATYWTCVYGAPPLPTTTASTPTSKVTWCKYLLGWTGLC